MLKVPANFFPPSCSEVEPVLSSEDKVSQHSTSSEELQKLIWTVLMLSVLITYAQKPPITPLLMYPVGLKV